MRTLTLPLTLVLVSLLGTLLNGCNRKIPTHKDSVTALRELASEFPREGFATDLKVISSDPELIAGHQFRPTFLKIFSMLDVQAAEAAGLDAKVAELAFSLFVVGDHELPAETWKLKIGGQTFKAIKAERHQRDAKITRIIRGRFSKLTVTFGVPRDEIIEAIQEDPDVTIFSTTLPEGPWTFSSPRFAQAFKEVRDMFIKDGDQALNWHVRASELAFRKTTAATNAEQDGAGQPPTRPEFE